MIWKVILFGFVAVIGGGIYGTFFTSLPVQGFLATMPSEKIKVESIDGSILSGFQFENVMMDTDYFRLEVKEAGQKYDAFAHGSQFNKKLELKSFYVKEGILELKPAIYEKGQETNSKNVSSSKHSSSKNNEQIKQELDFILSIVDVNFSNLKLIVPANPNNPLIQRKEFELKNFILKDLMANINTKENFFELKIAQNNLETGSFKYNLQDILITQESLKWKEANFGLSKVVAPFLKQDIELNIKGEVAFNWIENQEGEREIEYRPNIDLWALGDQLNLKISEDKVFHLSAMKFNPQDFIQIDSPLKDISFKTSMANPMMLMMGAAQFEQMSFSVGEIPFISVNAMDSELIEQQNMDRKTASMTNSREAKFEGQWEDHRIELGLSPTWLVQLLKPQGGLQITYESSLPKDEFAAHSDVNGDFFKVRKQIPQQASLR